jgi:excisionase family DNA binding protein
MVRDEGGWLSTREAARQLGVTVRTLYRLVDGGELAAYRIGRVFRIKQTDLEAFLDDARVKPGELEHLYASGDAEVGDVEVEDVEVEDDTPLGTVDRDG